MRVSCLKLIIVVGLAGLLTGCSTCCWFGQNNALPQVKAAYAPTPITLDGNLDEAAWNAAQTYQLQLSKDVHKRLPEFMKKTVGSKLHEPGEYRLLWDNNYLYIGATFTDSDIYAYGDEDQMHHYSMGDVAEVFIKPETDTYYWELYATPTGKKTTFFIPGRGCLMSTILTREPIDIKVAAQIKGSLNNWHDRDQSWSMEMAIPRKELEKYGAKFGPGNQWRIFLARYNYSRYLPLKELSSFPQQVDVPNFHALEEYGKLELVNP